MIKIKKTYKNCPICSSTKITKTIEHNTPSGDMVKSWKETHEKRIFFPYNICKECSLHYVNKYFSIEDLSKLYNELEDNLYSQSLTAHFKTQEDYKNILLTFYKNNNKPKKILEFGPDLGILTNYISKEFNPEKYFLVEPNRKQHITLSKIKNSEIYEQYSQIENLSDNSIDLIIMVHVFDHILNPKEKLIILKKKLRKNGRIFFVTHNTNSILRYLLNKNWPPFCMYHPQLYNEKSLLKLFQICKFQDIEIVKTNNYFKLSSCINALLSVLKIYTFFNFGPVLKIKVGNIATIAQK